MADLNPASSPVKPTLKLEKHGEEFKVDVTLFKQIVGSLRYVCNRRIDICFSVELVRRYMDEPKVSHMKDIKRIMIYLKGSLNCGILFPQESEGKEVMMNCYSNVNWHADKDDRSITNNFFEVFGMQSNGARERNMWWHYNHARLSI